MAPPTGPLNLDVEAISGICGSISIACWVVVFSPQIIENFRRSSADGLSLQFIIVWLAGDVFNILGAVLQGVLPTMIILAVYYTIADIVLLGQCFYYRGFTWRDEVVPPPPPPKTKAPKKITAQPGQTDSAEATERTALLGNGKNYDAAASSSSQHPHPHPLHERRGSNWSALSPAVPFVPDIGHEHQHQHHEASSSSAAAAAVPAPTTAAAPTRSVTAARLRAAAFNVVAMLMVCAAGVAGWYLSSGHGGSKDGGHKGDDTVPSPPSSSPDDLVLDVWGQVFGYFCAVLYLGSRLPQLLLNWRRQSTDGVSMLFFLFACLGNLTYVLSIFAYDGCQGVDADLCTPALARHRYGRYLLVNLSWLAGSLGTLLLDMGIFVQFFLYRVADGDEEDFYYDDDDDEDAAAAAARDDDDQQTQVAVEADEGESSDEEGHMNRWDQRPLLERNLSTRD